LVLYKYVGIDGLRRILDGSIRFTQPSAFNDPFELLPEIIVPNDAPERQISVFFDILAARRAAPDSELEAIPTGEQLDGHSTGHWSSPHNETKVVSRQGCMACTRSGCAALWSVRTRVANALTETSDRRHQLW
jgi:hypothetical protein